MAETLTMSKQKQQKLELDVKSLHKAKLVYRAINHKLRLQILHLIHREGRIIVTKIYKTLRIEQSVASQHLAILRSAGYVKTERDGKFIFYSVNYDRIKQVHEIADQLLTKTK